MAENQQYTIAFGFQKFWPEVVARFPGFFEPADRLQQAVASIVDPARADISPNQHLLLNLLMLVSVGMAEVVTLVGNGMGNGAMKIVRGMVENAVNAEYIRRYPEQGERYIAWHWVEIHKLYRYMQENSPASLNDIAPEKIASDEEEYQRVKGLFRYQVTTLTGTRTVRQDSWCRDNLYERSVKTGFAQSYATVMPSANQILHGSIGGLLSHMDSDGTGLRIEYPPTHRWAAEALLSGHLAMLQAIETAARVFETDSDPGIERLKQDFQELWGQQAQSAD